MGIFSGRTPWHSFLFVASVTFFAVALCLATDPQHSKEHASNNVTTTNGSSTAIELQAQLHQAVSDDKIPVHARIHKQQGGGGGGGGGGGVGGGGGGGGGGRGRGGWGYGWGWGSMGGGGGGGGGGSWGGGGGRDVNGGCWWRCEEDEEGGRHHRHGGRGGSGYDRQSYRSSLYRVGEYARCSGRGRCGGMELLCPMHCNGPCLYDCESNCRAHCRF